ncbi:MAG: glycosyltransferase family 4 protein [Myxococcota bacterium]
MSLPAEGELRVGVDATTWANDRGFGRFTRELVTAMAARDRGLRYTLVFDQPPRLELPAGVEVLCASTRRSLGEAASGDGARSVFDLLRLGLAVRRAAFDVFFFPAVFSYFPLPSRVPCVVCYHDATAERFGEMLFPTRVNRWLWNAKTRLAHLQTSRAMTVSRSSADDLVAIHGFAPARVDQVTEAADPCFRVLDDPDVGRRARVRHGLPEDAALLVHVGGMNRHKNLLRLLQAMPEVVAARPDVHLALVGSTTGEGFWDNVPELQAYVRDHAPLDRHVHFTGRIEDDGLVELLNGAAALVFPSLWEGSGLPAVEAMSCGVPVLASRRGSLPEVVGDAGGFFDPESVPDIARCILGFLGDAELRRRLGERALARVERFSWDRAAELAEESLRRCHREAR